MLPKELKVYLEDVIAELERYLESNHTDYNQGYKDALADIRDGVWKPTHSDLPTVVPPPGKLLCACGRHKAMNNGKCHECNGIPF